MKTIYDTLSIRGRVAYAIMCFERYVTLKYPNKDMATDADMIWKIIDNSDYIANSAYHYMEIIPEYLFEASDYASSEFDYLTEEDYDCFTGLLPTPDIDADLNTIMHSIYDVAMEYAYTAVELDAPETKDYLQEVSNILKANYITLPDVSAIPPMNGAIHMGGDNLLTADTFPLS